MAAKNYEINYNDERFKDVESDKEDALNELNNTYDSMISQSDSYFQAQIDASKEWAEQQAELQNQQTQHTIDIINQQKEQTQKDYIKEQSGAYADWQKQSDQYGANAEQMAAQGMQNTGYSESSQVSMYNTYQNRVASAKEAYGRAVLNYDNAIKEAQLQNSSILAEIAANALQEQLALALQGFQYKNQLILQKADKKTEIDNNYYGRYQDVLAQINHENALAEQIRQHNASIAQQKAALAEERRQFDEQMKYQKAKDAAARAAALAGSAVGSGTRISKSRSGSKSKTSSASKTKDKVLSVTKPIKASSKSSGSGATSGSVDMKSVLALGYGPISASKLADLENRGLIESYESGGKIKFRKSAYAIKQSQLFK